MIRRFAVLPALGAALAAAALGAGPAAAAPTPIEDPNAVGYIGFCDTAHHQVRGGVLGAAPFAWTAASSVAAPAGYEKGKASLYAYQPRKNTNPSDWSGRAMTAASTFSNSRTPMASGTQVDPALVDFTAVYTPEVKGLVQLRMSYTAPNRAPYITDYPAVFIRVTGNRWTQVDGGTVNCAAGTARSAELDALSTSRLTVRNPRPAPETAAQVAAHASSAPSASAGRSGASASTGAATGSPSPADTATARPSADSSSSDDGGSSAWIWFVAGGVVVLGAGSALAARKLRTSTPVDQ